jgi:hypothetical protein
MTRQLYQGGGVSSLEQARDVLQAQALPGEFLAYINPQEAMMLKAMGGAGEPINQSGIPSFFVKKFFKSAKKAVSGAVDAVTDFAKSDIGQIALAIAAPYALGAYVPGFATLGGSGFAGAALRSGITSLATQGLTTGRFDLGQAAKAGVIGGAINTGLRNYQQTGNAFSPGDVTTGGDVLKSTVVQDPSIDFEGVQYSDAAAPSVSEAISKPVTFEEAFGEGATLSDIQKTQAAPTTTATPQTPTSTPTPTTSTFDFDPNEPISGAIGMEPIQGKFGQTTGTRFTIPTGDTEMISTIKGGIENIPLADRTGQFSTEIKNVFREGATLSERATSAVDALKQISGAALDRPMSSIAIASLLSAASVPQQPDESDFDYEERMKIVNDYASYYGERAGVDMSGAGDIEDYESYYSQRARVADGGVPKTAQDVINQLNPYGTYKAGDIIDAYREAQVQQKNLDPSQIPTFIESYRPPASQGLGGQMAAFKQNQALTQTIRQMQDAMNSQSSYQQPTMQLVETSGGMFSGPEPYKSYGVVLDGNVYKTEEDAIKALGIERYNTLMADGGRVRKAMGGDIDVPTGNVRKNKAGIMELDYRDTGGRVPIGIKERADDVPAMLSKDEFVFTSKAVKNAGNGDVDKGAEKLYKVMNILENGGTV